VQAPIALGSHPAEVGAGFSPVAAGWQGRGTQGSRSAAEGGARTGAGPAEIGRRELEPVQASEIWYRRAGIGRDRTKRRLWRAAEGETASDSLNCIFLR
jgi:hypothetical protein